MEMFWRGNVPVSRGPEREGNPQDSTGWCSWVTEAWPACAWSSQPTPARALPSGQPGPALPPWGSSQHASHSPPNPGACLCALSAGLGIRDRVLWQGPDGARDGQGHGGLGQTAPSFPGCPEFPAGDASVPHSVAPFELQPCRAHIRRNPQSSRSGSPSPGPA